MRRDVFWNCYTTLAAGTALLLAGSFSTTAAHLRPTLGFQFLRCAVSKKGSKRPPFPPRQPTINGLSRRPFSATIAMRNKASEDGTESTPLTKSTSQHKPSVLAGMPIGPSAPSPKPVILRYIYEGDHLGHGRLCHLPSATTTQTEAAVISVAQVIRALRNDGVDFDLFYACAYETCQSTGGWMPLEPAPRYRNRWRNHGNDDEADSESTLTFRTPPEDTTVARRIDVKLIRRPRVPSRTSSIQSLDNMLDSVANEHYPSEPQQSSALIEHSSEALQAISASVPGGKISCSTGYFGIGILSPKTSANVGTLWRSAYQLGASVLYTIGGRYKPNSTDTLNVPARLPLIELDDWSSFVTWGAPKGAVWVVVEMGGTPLAEFEHPRNAIYILGSEDHGVPKSVVRGCREVVSLESEAYGSYNVAVAGSIVMYDRLVKLRKAEGQRREKK